jgi:ABC-2 type transport system permease protein
MPSTPAAAVTAAPSARGSEAAAPYANIGPPTRRPLVSRTGLRMTGHRIFAAFLRRDWQRARSYRTAYVLQFFAIFFHLALYFFLGQLFDRSSISTDPALARGYFTFYFLGSIMLQFVGFALSVYSTNLAKEQMAGSLEALLATPPPPALLLSAGIGYDLLFTIAAEFVAIVTALLFFGLDVPFRALAIVVSVIAWVATMVIFGAAGLALAAFTMMFKRGVSTPIDFLTTGLGLACGIYYPVDVLPGSIQFVSKLLPLTWSVNVIRDALLHDRIDLGLLALLIATGALTVPIGVRFFMAGLDQAKRQGSLGQF